MDSISELEYEKLRGINGQDKLPKCCNDVNQQINLANNLSINRNKEDGEITIDAALQHTKLRRNSYKESKV